MPPSVEINNGVITATVYLPDAAVGYYRGTRFDWAGVIGRLEYRGHTFYAPWFTSTDPGVLDFVNDGIDITAGPQTAATGPVEEFSVLGFEEAAPGGAFVKIGVGALRRPMDGDGYNRFRSYELADPGTRRVTVSKTGVDFVHELADTGTGYAYHYSKSVRLNPGSPVLVIANRLVNRGQKPIVGTVYNHNFLVLDGETPGPDVVITAPFDITAAEPLDPAAARIAGRELRYIAPIAATGRVSADLRGFGPTPADNRFTIENRKAGAGVEMIGDRTLNRLVLWSIRTVLALEPFLALNIEPGAAHTWECTYRYYTIPRIP